MIDDLNCLVFLHPSRTGGTSVEAAIMNRRISLNPDLPSSAFQAAGLRYFGRVENLNTQHFTWDEMSDIPDYYRCFATVRCPYKRAASMLSYISEKFSSFEELVTSLKGRDNYRWVRPQTDYTHGQHSVDAIVRICDGEQVNRDTLERCVGQTIPHINSSPSLELSLKDKAFIRRMYARDFELLGYPV